MKNTISLSDFEFKITGYGHYEVTYTSPNTQKSWTTKTSNIPLIDATKNAKYPKFKDLHSLKQLCKNG